MSNSDLPEDPAQRSDGVSDDINHPKDAISEPPSDSVLRRHYDQMHDAAAAASSSPESATPDASVGSESTLQSDAMTSSNVPIYKRLLFLALLTLAGVIALYQWYSEKLKGNITDRETQVSESVQQLSEAKAKLGLFAESEKDLRSEMEAAAAQHQQEVTRLKTEQQQAAADYTQLQQKFEAANQKVTGLNSDVQTLQQSLTAAEQQHQAQVAELNAQSQTQIQETQQRMAERIDYYRLALEGSEPQLAEQLAAMDQKIISFSQDLESTRNTVGQLEAAKAELDQQLAAAMQEIQQQQQALAQAGQDLVTVQENLTQRQNLLIDLKSEYDKATSKAAQELAASQEELRLTNEAHAAAMAEAKTLMENTKAAAVQAAAAAAAELEKTRTDAAAAMQQATDEYTATITAAEGKISTLSQDLEQEKAALAALQEKYDTTVVDLNAKLADTSAKLDATIADAATAKQTLEGEISTKQARIAELEQTIADEREQAAQELLATKREHDDSLTRLQGLHADLSSLGGRQTEQGTLLSLANTELRFRIGGAKLPRGDLPNLDRIAELLNKYPSMSARIEGHTDNTGRDETNKELSYQRANAVMEALVERGVAIERMTAEGIGADRPIASNDTPFGRLKNRRVEIYITEN